MPVSTSPTYTKTPALTQDEPEPSYVRTYDARLVPLVGAHAAMVLGQIKYWLERPGGKDHDGYHWIWKSGPELSAEIGLSPQQVKRSAADLCAKGVLVAIRNPIKGWDRKFWYRINEDHECMVQICTMHGTTLNRARYESEPSMEQNDTMHGSKRHHARDESEPAIPESTSEDDEQESTPATHTKEDSSTARETVWREGEGRSARKGRTKPSKRKARRGVSDPLATQEPSGDQDPASAPNGKPDGSENPLVLFRNQDYSMKRLHIFLTSEEERGTPVERTWSVSGKHNQSLGQWTATPKDFLAMVEAAL